MSPREKFTAVCLFGFVALAYALLFDALGWWDAKVVLWRILVVLALVKTAWAIWMIGYFIRICILVNRVANSWR